MHTHCLPISRCAHHQPEDLPEIFLKKGINAIVLTNHCYPAHLTPLTEDLNEQAEIYIDTYRRCKAKGEEVGVKVIFGVELKLINEPNTPEFLLYGLSEEDFKESFPLYNKTQEELFEFCNSKNVLMIQAHPFREEQGYAPANMEFLHGLEVYNGHPHFDNGLKNTIPLTDRYNLLKTAGTDFHVEMQAGLVYIEMPEKIEDQFMLRDYIKNGKIEIYNTNGMVYKA